MTISFAMDLLPEGTFPSLPFPGFPHFRTPMISAAGLLSLSPLKLLPPLFSVLFLVSLLRAPPPPPLHSSSFSSLLSLRQHFNDSSAYIASAQS